MSVEPEPLACAHELSSGVREPVPFELLEATDEEREREQRRRALGLLAQHVDAHVHLFPLPMYQALWRWFDKRLWRIRFRGDAEQALGALRAQGARRVVSLAYAHRAGIAEPLNAFLGELARAERDVVPVGTVFPGEPDAAGVVERAVRVHGARGIKLHCHVMRVAIDHPVVLEVLRACARLDVPAVVHAGREPAHQDYGVDTHAVCNVRRTERALEQVPGLRLVVPHVGADEFAGYLALLERWENLWLDTSVACAGYFDEEPPWEGLERRAERVLYGTDFPITPYEPDRELRMLARKVRGDEALASILRGAAESLWGC